MRDGLRKLSHSAARFLRMLGVTLDQWLDILQLGILAAGGAWALFLYRTSRSGEAKLGIEVRSRLIRDFVPEKSLLLAELTISNASSVLWRNEETVATLFDARKIANSGSIQLVPFAQADPFLPVYGIETEDVREIENGRTFAYGDGQQIMLEPGEQVRTDLAFALDTNKIGLMAMKVWVSGLQRNRANEPFEWSTFLFVDPDSSASSEKPTEPSRME